MWGPPFRIRVSNKIRIETLEGKIRHDCRVRVQRLVDRGHAAWIDDRNAREIVPKTVNSDPARFLRSTPAVVFDPDRLYPDFAAHPELFNLPFNYPLPRWLLRSYAS